MQLTERKCDLRKVAPRGEFLPQSGITLSNEFVARRTIQQIDSLSDPVVVTVMICAALASIVALALALFA
jgi:hypothetical protein